MMLVIGIARVSCSREAATVGDHLSSVIPVLHRDGPGSVRVGERQVHHDTGIDS
jgi:hypothetical protein